MGRVILQHEVYMEQCTTYIIYIYIWKISVRSLTLNYLSISDPSVPDLIPLDELWHWSLHLPLFMVFIYQGLVFANRLFILMCFITKLTRMGISQLSSIRGNGSHQKPLLFLPYPLLLSVDNNMVGEPRDFLRQMTNCVLQPLYSTKYPVPFLHNLPFIRKNDCWFNN